MTESSMSRNLLRPEFIEGRIPLDATRPVQNTPMDSNAITQADWNRFRAQTMPMIDRLTQADDSIIRGAERTTANLAERSNEQIAKVNGRRISRLSPAQQRLITQAVNADSAGTAASTLTNAQIQQRDVNDAARNNAMGFANALGNQGIGLLSNAEAMKAQREAQNRANKKGFMSSALGLVGTVGGAIVGTSFSNPMLGAAIGGAVGNGLGGM